MRVLAILVLLAATATAEPKRTLVVAGVDGIDSESVPLATAATAALRAVKSPRYALKGTPKQILAAVVKAECRVTQTACAVAVGTELGAEYVLAGEATNKGKHKILVLSLVNVQTKQRMRSLREIVASTVDTKRWANLMFQRLVDAGTGELHLVANVKQAEVYIDGQLVAALYDGRTTITNLAAGAHQVVVKAKGYRTFELDVTIDGSTKETLLLEPESP